MPKPKQAVLLIHGIGEQRPMESLRGFVRAVWTTDIARQREQGDNRAGLWSKPYSLGQDFELRRLTTAENRAGWRTDFFEFYWAHLMHGTQVGHVVAWAKALLLRWPGSVPRHLRLAYWTLVILLVVALYLAYRGAVARAAGATGLPVWANLLVSVAIVPLILGILVNVVGDAARYLHVSPPNVQRRHEIRAAGVKVLDSLHKAGYDRIIVVGHSLGSVIGFDILYHAWAASNTQPPTAQVPAYLALGRLEQLAVDAESDPAIGAAVLQDAQRQYFNELNANGNNWRVTDFITLGSPLAHAEILLARDAATLKTKFEDREFACCPPTLETSHHAGRELRRFSYPADQVARTPHHAAVFGPVRWTNLFFPNHLLVWGDPVGGRLAGIFGRGVRDVAVRTSLRAGFLTHTCYWQAGYDGDTHINTLRDTLDLLDAKGNNAVVAPAPAGKQP